MYEIKSRFTKSISLRDIRNGKLNGFIDNLMIVLPILDKYIIGYQRTGSNEVSLYQPVGYTKSEEDYILTLLCVWKAFGFYLLPNNEKIKDHFISQKYLKRMYDTLNRPEYHNSILGRCYRGPSLYLFFLVEVSQFIGKKLNNNGIIFQDIIRHKSVPVRAISKRQLSENTICHNMYMKSCIDGYNKWTPEMIKWVYRKFIRNYKFLTYKNNKWQDKKSSVIMNLFGICYAEYMKEYTPISNNMDIYEKFLTEKKNKEKLNNNTSLNVLFNEIANDPYYGFAYNSLIIRLPKYALGYENQFNFIETILRNIPEEFYFSDIITKESIKILQNKIDIFKIDDPKIRDLIINTVRHHTKK